MKKLKILRIVASSSFAWSFGRMSRDELYHRFDRAAELAGRGPRYFSGHRRDEAV
jgi:hypothetical protein